MLKFMYDHAVIIAISLSFFVFGFILGADVFDLSSENILAVMIGGAACGMTILLYLGPQTKVFRFAIPTRPARSE